VRILIVSTAFPRYPDDPTAKWLVETIGRLAAEGYEFEVLTSAYRGGGNSTYNGIPVHRFRYFFARWERLTHEESAPDRMRRSVLYKILPLFYVVAGTVAAWRLGRRGRFDIVHVHWPVPHALFGWAARAAAPRRPKIIAHFYSIEVRWVRHSLRILTGFLRRAITSADRVVAISASTANEIRAVASSPVEVIPYAVDLPHPSRLAALPGAPGTRPLTLLYVGRLVERKGVRYLIEALPALPAALRARVVIIGDGPERDALQSTATTLGVADRVSFRGWVTPEELDRAYTEATIFALPAVVDARGDTEGLGMVLLEAMTYGLPVISTPLGGITDIVEDHRTGLLVPPNDAGAVAAAITSLAQDPALASRLAAAGQEHARVHFSWESVLAAWRALYAGVLAPVDGAARAQPPSADPSPATLAATRATT
jgi:glycosyltransferase involved in cell wall biosynthesis